MPLQNRVDPFGELHAATARGRLMGNRGGRLHRQDRTLGARRWSSKAWIYCRTKFKDRRRQVMGDGYTELFFLDEPTALAAGHRPCFECQRADAMAFASAWARGQGADQPPRASEMDAQLHCERIDHAAPTPRLKRLLRRRFGGLPAGVMVALWGESWLIADAWLLRWRFDGYDAALPRWRALDAATVDVLTPPSTVAALRGGYEVKVDCPLF